MNRRKYITLLDKPLLTGGCVAPSPGYMVEAPVVSLPITRSPVLSSFHHNAEEDATLANYIIPCWLNVYRAPKPLRTVQKLRLRISRSSQGLMCFM